MVLARAVPLAEWYESLIANIVTNIQSLAIAIVITIFTWVFFREIKRLFAWLKVRKKLHPLIVDVLESGTRYIVSFIGILLIMLDISFPLGLHDIVLKGIPHFVVAAITFITTWLTTQILKVIFDWVRAREALPLEVIGPIELLVKYSVIAVGSSFLILYVLAGLGYAEVITSLLVGWFASNISRITLIVVAIALVRIASRFLKTLFEDLKKRTTFQPKVVDIGGAAVRYLLYLVVGLIVLSSLLQIIGAPELIPLLTSVFSVLFGVGFSFAAAGAIGNFIAGLVLTSWRPYDIGDRVEVGGGAYGDVEEFDILFTKIKTVKNEIISVPNLSVLGNKITNYSALGRCIVHSRISVAYDYDRRTIEDLLLRAASMTEGIVNEPKAFVLVPELSNFYAVYEINAYTDKPNHLATIYSNLHKNILDVFNEAQIELLTPSYAMETPFFWGGIRNKRRPTE